MELNELLTFIGKQKDLLQSQYKNVEESKMTLAMTVKLSEEVGELSQEILGNLSLVRKEKLNKHNLETLSDEFADVLITTLILAKKMNVNVAKALEAKIDKLDKRNGLEKDWWR